MTMNDNADKQTAENGSAPSTSSGQAASLPPSGDDGRGEAGRFSPGNAGGPGRPAGSPNKVNAVLKDDILTAYQQRGGIDWLRGLGDRDFVRLIQKVMPRDLHVEAQALGIPIQVVMFGVPAGQRSLAEAPDDGEARPPGLT